MNSFDNIKIKVEAIFDFLKDYFSTKLEYITSTNWQWNNFKNIIIYLLLFLWFLFWTILNIKIYKLHDLNEEYQDKINILENNIKIIKDNKNKFILLDNLDLEKNSNIITIRYNIYLFIDDKNRKFYNPEMKIYSIKPNKKQEFTIEIWWIKSYYFIDHLLAYLKQFKTNISVEEVKWQIDNKFKGQNLYKIDLKIKFKDYLQSNNKNNER